MARIIGTSRILHSHQRSRIKTVEPLPDFTPPSGGTYYGVQIVFENGDTVRHYDSSFTKIRSFAVGSVYHYQLEDLTEKYDDGSEKQKIKFAYQYLHMPYFVQASMNRVEEIQWYIKRAAELAANSFNGDLNVFDETEFKDRASVIYGWMRDKLFTEDFGEDVSVLESQK
jgi:hypothetical protein